MKAVVIRFAAVAVLALGVIVPASAAAGGLSPDAQFPKGAIVTLEGAGQALEIVTEERTRIEARYNEEKGACLSEFFVNSCIEEAKERRHQALEPLTRIELEAKRFQRQERARARDRDAAERQARAAEKAAQAAASEPRIKQPKPPQEPPASVPERRVPPTPTPEEAREEARRRAENEAAYARKLEAAKERQETVARRKAEKERRREEREAIVSGVTSAH